MDEEELDDEVEASKPKGSSTKLIIIISIIALIAIGGSVAATLMLVGGSSGEAVEETSGESSEKKGKKVKKKAIYIDLDPAFTVNFANQQAVRFLQIQVQLMSRDELVAESVREHAPMIRSHLVMLFSSQDSIILGTREGKEQLRKDTLAEINKILEAETGKAGVEAVFFTSLVMQ